MKILGWMSLGMLSAALCGCGGSAGGGSSGDGGSGQGGTGQTSSGQGGSAQSGSGQGGSGQGGSGQGGSGQSSTGQGGGGSVCGGMPGTPCSAGEYCDYVDDQCGNGDATGVCAPLPQGCPTVYMPACACDGMVYSNACEAQAAGVDISNAGGCPSPAGTFSCGPEFCAKGQQYCSNTLSDVPGIPDSYSCPPLPPACFQGTPPTCACLDGVCGAPMQNCSASPDGDLTVVCPGG